MGGTQPSKELTILESLQELCRAGDIAADGGGWALQKRYAEMTALCEKNRTEFLCSGGVAATVALMLSKPGDQALQEFSLNLMCKTRPSIAQVALAWHPVLHAVNTFPGNPAIQELGTSLLLRGSLSRDLEGECVQAMGFLHGAANMLAEGMNGGGTAAHVTATLDIAPPHTSLCGEVLEALEAADGRPAPLVELWYKTLALTAHFVAAQDVPRILALLRHVFAAKAPSRGVLLSSLFALQRMQEAAQLHVQAEEMTMVKHILADAQDDVEIVLRVFGVFRSVAFTPSAPHDAADMLARILAVLRNAPKDGGVVDGDTPAAAAGVLLAHASRCPATLLQSADVANDLLLQLLGSSSSIDAVDTALEVLNMTVTTDVLNPVFRARAVAGLGSVLGVERYHRVLPYLAAWAGDVRNTPDAPATRVLTDAVQRALVDDLLRYLADENQRWRVDEAADMQAHVLDGLAALTAWAPLAPPATHLGILCLADALLAHAACFDRGVVAAVAALVPRLHQTHARQVHHVFAVVHGREVTYWFPHKPTLAVMKDFAAAVPRAISDTWELPEAFQRFVYES